MCGAVTQGTVALPGSEAASRMNGSRRNLGDLTPHAVAMAIPGHDRKSRRRSCWGRREESDGCIIPTLFRRPSCEKVAPSGQFEIRRSSSSVASMTDGLSTLYQDLLSGSYDCVDRIVLNAYFRMGHSPGGIRGTSRGPPGTAQNTATASHRHIDSTF